MWFSNLCLRIYPITEDAKKSAKDVYSITEYNETQLEHPKSLPIEKSFNIHSSNETSILSYFKKVSNKFFNYENACFRTFSYDKNDKILHFSLYIYRWKCR